MASPAPQVTAAITVTEPARALIRRHLDESPRDRFVRVRVARS